MNNFTFILICLILNLIDCFSFGNQKKNNDVEELQTFEIQIIKMQKVVYPGIGLGDIKIGMTKYSQLITSEATRLQLQNAGFEFHFEQGEILKEIILQNTGEFLSEENQVIGNRKEDIIKIYGNPISENKSLSKGQISIGQINTLNYNGLYFFLQDGLVKYIVITEFK